ncbi:hypothetical protein [Paenibacillus odorifer]|uniref:hypothetical protein n=1 Tax=Paenibacillus odorifer TaxID=189426 RepID=UPI0011C940E1|nr:hypothetical protein [Paenibacillus odorifer]
MDIKPQLTCTNRRLRSPESGLAKIEDTTASFGLYRSYLVFLEHYSEVSDRIALIAKFLLQRGVDLVE